MQNEIKLVSFDVFDTLISRACADSRGIFYIMEYILKQDSKFGDFDSCLIDNFSFIRQNVHYELSKKVAITKMQPTLDDIYSVIKNKFSLSDVQIQKLIDLELKVEINNVFPIYKNIELLKNYVKENKKVILISDMYFNQTQIRTILANIDNVFKDIPIEVSSQLNSTKQSGDIYPIIFSKYAVKYTDWLHYGDNPIGDVKSCKKFNIRTKQIYKPKLFPFEDSILRLKNNIIAQIYIGASKNVRYDEFQTKTFYFGSSFAGPILYSYVKFLLNSAIKRKISSLYFIARDGYILKLIADEIVKRNQLPIRTRYIYGSRIAFRNPNNEQYKEFINNTIDEIDTVANLKIGIDLFEIDGAKKIIKNNDKTKLKKILFNDYSLQEKIMKKFSLNREMLSKYIKQEIDFSENFAFVDMCGTGKSQDFLQSVINEFDNRRISTFYFYSPVLTNLDISEKIPYLTAVKSSLILELLTRCPGGQTIGYQEKDGIIAPIVEKYNSSQFLKWGFEDYKNGIIQFVKNMCEFEQKNNIDLYSLKLVNDYLSSCNIQNKFLCDILGSIPNFKLFGAEENCKEQIAKPYSFVDLFKKRDSKTHVVRFTRSRRFFRFLFGRKKIIFKFNVLP